jgi:hypothetical protein
MEFGGSWDRTLFGKGHLRSLFTNVVTYVCNAVNLATPTYYNIQHTTYYILLHTTTYYYILLHTTTYYYILQHTAYYNILHTTTYYNILHTTTYVLHTTTYYNILQHTTYYNILHRSQSPVLKTKLCSGACKARPKLARLRKKCITERPSLGQART